jgi:hypothetical protein
VKIEKRSDAELRSMPRPSNPSELEVLSYWYFGKALHLSRLDICGASVSYAVREEYNSYHGNKWLHMCGCIDGYDYSARFWNFVIGILTCGGIAGHSYGQARVIGYRNALRLNRFSEYLRKKESGRLRRPYERLAQQLGLGESASIRGKRTLTQGRVDGASAAFSAGEITA